MSKFKLKTVAELFPDKAKELQKQDKEFYYGQMFKIDASKKKKIVTTLVEMVDEVKKQRQGYMDILEEAVRNYEGLESIKGNWEGSSNISTMVTTIAADMMHAKLFPMTWQPDKIRFEGTEKRDKELEENNTTMMRWVLTKDMENTQDKVDEGIHRLVVDGTLLVKRLWERYYTYVTRKVPERVN